MATNENDVPAHQKSTYNLFEDKAIKSAFENLPEDEQKKLKSQGEYMYSVDYANTGKQEEKLYERIAYAQEALKSGLRPSQLETEERSLFRSFYGNEWFRRYGFESEAD